MNRYVFTSICERLKEIHNDINDCLSGSISLQEFYDNYVDILEDLTIDASEIKDELTIK